MIDITGFTRKLLEGRNITEDEDIEEYLSGKPQKTYDPFLMKGIREAADRLTCAAENEEKICIYGDYDCDGVTAVFLLKKVLGMIMTSENVSHYIPSRFDEGYGLCRSAIEKISKRGVKLLITVDCGITQSAEIEYAKDLGMEVIVTDHHNISCEIPDCIVIDPKQPGCGYPFKGLCGCGVAYKLSQALQRQTGFDKTILYRMLDIVGIATIGDVVPLIDENRTLAKYGLNEIRTGRRENIRRLIAMMQRRYDDIDSYGVSFGIVPHLNAAGRMGSAADSLALLEAASDDDIRVSALRLIECNAHRRMVQDEAYERCIRYIDEQCPGSDFPVIRDDEAHEGIVGIVAGKLSENIHRPVIVFTEKDGVLKGSGRSIDEVDMYTMIKKHEDILERFGGHAAACGLTMKDAGLLPDLREALAEDMRALIESDPGVIEKHMKYDMQIEPADVSMKLAGELELFEPFGNANERPVFMMSKVKIKSVIFMGDEKQHLRFDAYKDGYSVKCVAFFRAQELADICVNENVCDVTGTIAVNEFRGTKTVQMTVKDIRLI